MFCLGNKKIKISLCALNYSPVNIVLEEIVHVYILYADFFQIFFVEKLLSEFT